jgi:multimeric flavodoxin WrbA
MSYILGSETNFHPGIKVFGVSGSPRKNGNSDLILEAILSGASLENVPTEYLNLSNIHFEDAWAVNSVEKIKFAQV